MMMQRQGDKFLRDPARTRSVPHVILYLLINLLLLRVPMYIVTVLFRSFPQILCTLDNEDCGRLDKSQEKESESRH